LAAPAQSLLQGIVQLPQRENGQWPVLHRRWGIRKKQTDAGDTVYSREIMENPNVNEHHGEFSVN